ncbi:MAG: iron-sulfur cluster assembly scaffold protein, partial [Methanomassiliicoccus sp.]
MALTDRIGMDENTMNDNRESSELDKLVDNIMVAIDADESAIYSKDVIAEFRNPANIGPIDEADGNGVADGLCMDTMEIWIKVEEDRITRCTFYTDGCG